jgi:hypothetical protein
VLPLVARLAPVVMDPVEDQLAELRAQIEQLTSTVRTLPQPSSLRNSKAARSSAHDRV